MKYEIREDGKKTAIRIEGVQGKEGALLSALKECTEGHCTCPTPEYGKLKSMKVEPGTDRVDIELEPKPGEVFHRPDIEKCLDHTIAKAAKS